MIGLSPTRPWALLLKPPVDVAAARCPWQSRATAPTVPCFSASEASRICPDAALACSERNASTRRCVVKYAGSTIASPVACAKSSAAAPASSTTRPSSSTARAALTGLRVRRTVHTAPAARVAPSMIEASSSCSPVSVNAAPWPALKCGLSSITTTAACTASSADPPARRICQPARRAWARWSRLSAHSAALSRWLLSVPQPPCRPIAMSAIGSEAVKEAVASGPRLR